jgi:glycosyltransferase involved in cell wall biosynthesis
MPFVLSGTRNMNTVSRGERRFLVMISYEIDIGYAIGRLVSVFHEMCARLAKDAGRIHFSFGSIGGKTSANLPAGFSNLLEFNYRNCTDADVARLLDYIRRHRITDIFALDMPVAAPFLGKARAAGVRDVVAYWGAPMSSENRGLRLLAKRLEIALLRRDRPDLFVFESEAMRHLAVNGRGLPRGDTTVIHTGVDPQRFRPMTGQESLVRERFAIPDDRRIIVYMGHLHARKGVHVLMRAAQHLVTQLGRQDVHTLFLGNRNGEEKAFAEHVAGAEKFVTFGGYQSDIPQLLAGCHAGCIPSTGWDSFPMSSIEMQACGLPVIVSDWQGVPETVADGVTGIVTKTGDAPALAHAIAALVDDPARRDRMSAAALERTARAFTREHQIQNLVNCLATR